VETRVLELDDVTFLKLRRRILDSSGILVDDDKTARRILERRLWQRIRFRGLDSFAHYEETLNDVELGVLLDLVAVHETYFFRENKQLGVFADDILRDLSDGRRSSSRVPLKMWSAGCSTGEEAYTLAILLAERGINGDQCVVLASDISSRVLWHGREGVYKTSSFRSAEPWYRNKYFTETGEGKWRANNQLRSMIRFSQSNIVRSDETVAAVAGAEGFDVICCRNVLMYFEQQAALKALSSFHRLLREGGYLLVGHAEGLLPTGSSFRPVHFGREMVHRK